jgi:outer membrane protein assembly factor BamB
LCSGGNGVPPAVASGTLYIDEGCKAGATDIVAVSARTGSRRWHQEVVGGQAGLSVAGGIVAYTRWNGSQAYVGVLDATHGTTVWGPVSIGGHQLESMPAIAYGAIYYWEFLNDYGYIVAYNAQTGSQLWQYTIARSFASVANQIVWIAFNGSPLALNPATGQYLWNVGGTDNLGLPLVVNGVVYGGCNGPYVCAYGLPAQNQFSRRDTLHR